MRKGIMLPSWGMVGTFLIGLALALIWGIQGAVYGAEAFSQFFSSFALVIQYPTIGIILIMVLVVSLVKFFYFVVSFFIGILVGLLILMFLGSSILAGFTGSSSIIHLRYRGMMT